MSELRWNPLLGEWTITATHRQERTFFPPADYCPLCPTKAGGFPTEIPEPWYEIVAFENRFPSLQRHAPEPAVDGDDLFAVRPAFGVCEVIVYSPVHDAVLADLDVEHIDRVVRVLAQRTQALGALAGIEYVMPFENNGAAVGVTLSHPHGQIYAYPFIPPRVATELANARAHRARHGRCLFCDVLAHELADARRIVWSDEHWVAYIPFAARWPFETHLFPRRHSALLADFDRSPRRSLAMGLKRVLTGYNALFDLPFPYIMAFHQAPVDPTTHDDFHVHVELYPPMRTATKLKFLAGSETGGGAFINDTLPEDSAELLRAAIARAT